MEKVLLTTQVIISLLLMTVILIQNKDAGLTATMGSMEGFKSTRRGPEKLIYRTTVLLGTLFLLNAFMFVFV